MSTGLIIANLSTAVMETQKCRVSTIGCLDPAISQRYQEQCNTRCYACNLDAELGDTNLNNACPVSSACPKSSCPVISDDVSICPSSIAYVLHTSGTTGCPKRVCVPHCSIVPNIVDLRSRFNITPDDIIFNAAPLTFDPSFVEVSRRVYSRFLGKLL